MTTQRSVAIVTDSTAGLPAQVAATMGIGVVPLHVLIGEVDRAEGVGFGGADVEAALRRGTRVRTSRPSPVDFRAAYDDAVAAGATAIVSVHLSGGLSGTIDAARLAAAQAMVPVHVLDSRTAGLGLGFAALAGARLAGAGAEVGAVLGAMERRLGATSVLCYVHDLEFLRRGGRIGAAASLLGTALAMKPLIAIRDGRVEPVERQRTAARALSRLIDLAAEAVKDSGRPCDVAVQYCHHHPRVDSVVRGLTQRVGESMQEHTPVVAALPAVLAAHAGLGAVAVVVSPSAPVAA